MKKYEQCSECGKNCNGENFVFHGGTPEPVCAACLKSAKKDGRAN